MAFEHKIQKMVEFSHTDMAGIMHFSNFFRFMEAVEHDFFRSFDKSIVGTRDDTGNHLGWPRVNCECKFFYPLRFEEEIDLHLVVREMRSSSIRYEVIFSRMVEDEYRELARGGITIVHVGVDPETGQMKARELPVWVQESISVAPDGYKVKKNE